MLAKAKNFVGSTFTEAYLAGYYFFHDENGNIKRGAIEVVGGVATVFIGILVYAEIDDAIDRGDWTAAQNSTYTTVNTAALTAFTLLGVGLIVMGASKIMKQLQVW